MVLANPTYLLSSTAGWLSVVQDFYLPASCHTIPRVPIVYWKQAQAGKCMKNPRSYYRAACHAFMAKCVWT